MNVNNQKTALKNTVLITGGTGYIGSHLIDRLERDGFDVHLIIRQSSSSSALSEGYKSYVYDGTIVSMVHILQTVKPVLVFHLASLYITEHRPEQINDLVNSNILLGSHLLEAMSISGTGDLINAGTSWQNFISESNESPVNLYAATKEAFEAICNFYVDARGMRVITLRIFDTYGPHDRRPKLINTLFKLTKESLPLQMSMGEQKINLVYIDDVINAFILAAHQVKSIKSGVHEVFGVMGYQSLSIKRLVEVFQCVTKRVLSINWGSRPYRLREVMIPYEGLKPLPGWIPNISIEDGLQRIMNEGVAEK